MSRVRSKTRRFLRWIFLALAVLVLLVIVGSALVTVSPGEKIIRGFLEARLTAALHQPVTIDRFETNLFSRLELDTVVVRTDSQDGSPSVLTVDRIRARYRLWPLLRGTIAVDSLVVTSLSLNLSRDSTEGFNLALLDSLTAPGADTAVQASSGSGYTLQLKTASVTGVNLNYTDRVLGLNGFLHNLHLGVNRGTAGASFQLASDTGQLVYRDSPPGAVSIDVRGTFADSALTFDTLAVSLERLRLAAAGAISLDSTAPIRGRLRLTGDPSTFLDIAHRQFDLPEITMDSSILMTADLSGTRARPVARLALDLPATRIYDIDIAHSYLGARWTGNRASIDSLQLAAFGGLVTGHGDAAFDSTVTSSFELSLSSIDFATLWRALYKDQSPYHGTLGGSINLATVGTDWHNWRAQVAVATQDARYRNLPLKDLRIDATVDTGNVVASITQQHFNIDARVQVNEPNIEGTVNLRVDRLGPLVGLFNIPEVTGAVEGSARLSGTIDNPTLNASLHGHDITYRNFPVDTLALVAGYADSVVTLTDLTVSGRRDRLDSAGPVFGIDSLSGRLDYAAHLSGRLDSLTGQLDLHLRAPGYRGYHLDSAIVAATLNHGRVSLHAADLYRDSLFVTARGDFLFKGPSGTLSANAYDLTVAPSDTTAAAKPLGTAPYRVITNLESAFSLPDTGAFALSIKGQGIDLGALEDMLIDSLDVGGIASFQATLRGPTNDLSADLQLSVANPYYEDIRLDSLSTDVTLGHDTLTVSRFGLFGSDQSLAAHLMTVLVKDSTGSYTLDKSSPLRGQLDLDDLDLRVLEPFLWQDGQLSGGSNVHLTWDGTLADPNVRGRLAFDSVNIVLAPDIEPIERVNLVGSIQDTVLTIDSASGLIHKTPFNLKGNATLSGGNSVRTNLAMTFDTLGTINGNGLLSRDELNFTASIDHFDLALAQPFVPTVTNLGGTVSSRIELTGTAAAPKIAGTLDIENLTAGYEMLPQPLTNGIVKATFTRTNVSIDTASAAIGKGTVSAAGSFTYADSTITDINLRLAGRNVRIDPMPDFYLTVDSASLTYTKPNEYFQLGGDIVLGESKYQANLEPADILPWTRQVEETPPDFPEFIQQTRLNVRLRNSDKIWVDNNLAHIRMHAEMEAIGSVERPNLSGQLSIAEGYLLYLDRKFSVQDGVFYFNDPNKINPDLNLTAATSVTSYQALQATTYNITFSVQGTMEQPQVSLTSDPSLERADIVSLLTLGATRQQLAGGNGSSTGQVLQTRAETLASQQISGYVGQRVGNLLGLDQVSVQGNIFSPSDTTAELIAAKQISQNLRVTYKTRVGHLNDQAVQVNYDIWRNLSLEGQTNRRGDASLNLKYGIRFR